MRGATERQEHRDEAVKGGRLNWLQFKIQFVSLGSASHVVISATEEIDP